MTPERCLEWCRRYGLTVPDTRTARNVIEWLAGSSRRACRTSDDLFAVALAEARSVAVMIARPEPIPFYERPCAAQGLISFRYRHRRQWVMIGATDVADALNEARRSIEPATPDPAHLQQWCNNRYIPVDTIETDA